MYLLKNLINLLVLCKHSYHRKSDPVDHKDKHEVLFDKKILPQSMYLFPERFPLILSREDFCPTHCDNCSIFYFSLRFPLCSVLAYFLNTLLYPHPQWFLLQVICTLYFCSSYIIKFFRKCSKGLLCVVCYLVVLIVIVRI